MMLLPFRALCDCCASAVRSHSPSPSVPLAALVFGRIGSSLLLLYHRLIHSGGAVTDSQTVGRQLLGTEATTGFIPMTPLRCWPGGFVSGKVMAELELGPVATGAIVYGTVLNRKPSGVFRGGTGSRLGRSLPADAGSRGAGRLGFIGRRGSVGTSTMRWPNRSGWRRGRTLNNGQEIAQEEEARIRNTGNPSAQANPWRRKLPGLNHPSNTPCARRPKQLGYCGKTRANA